MTGSSQQRALLRRLDGLLAGEGEVFAADEADDVGEGGGPVFLGRLGVVAEGLDVEAEGEALLRAGEIDQRGAEDAVEHGEWMVERSDVAREPVQELFVLVERGEDGAFAPEDVDVADEAVAGVVGSVFEDVEVEAEVLELFCVFGRIERPGIALGGEDWRARRVEGAEGMHERRIELCFGEEIEIVGILAQVDEAAVAGRV